MTQQRLAPVRHYIYHDISHRHVKIHLEHCDAYTGRDGEITYRNDDGRMSGKWHGPYPDFVKARSEAKILEGRVMTCMHCLKEES